MPVRRVWGGDNKSDTEKIERLQLQMARYIMKASRITPRTALYGDLGWTSIATIQNSLRIKYMARINEMDMHRWPKLLFYSMINLNCNVNTLRYKFLNSITNLFDMCGSENIIENIRKGQDPTNPRWATSVIHEMYYVFKTEMVRRISKQQIVS